MQKLFVLLVAVFLIACSSKKEPSDLNSVVQQDDPFCDGCELSPNRLYFEDFHLYLTNKHGVSNGYYIDYAKERLNSEGTIMSLESPSGYEFLRIELLSNFVETIDYDVDGLGRRLKEKFPDLNWKEINLQGSHDFQPDFLRDAKGWYSVSKISAYNTMDYVDYYFLYDNLKVMNIRFREVSRKSHNEINRDIFQSIALDFKDPKISRITVSPQIAKAGDEVTVSVFIEDQNFFYDQSNPRRRPLGARFISSNYGLYQQFRLENDNMWFGYDIEHDDRKNYNLAYAIPAKKIANYHYDGSIRYVVKIPEWAPEGELILGKVYLEDLFHRQKAYTVEQEMNANGKYVFAKEYIDVKTKENTGIKRASVQIQSPHSINHSAPVSIIQNHSEVSFWNESMNYLETHQLDTWNDYKYQDFSFVVETDSQEYIYDWRLKLQERVDPGVFVDWNCIYIEEVEYLSTQKYRLKLALDYSCWTNREDSRIAFHRIDAFEFLRRSTNTAPIWESLQAVDPNFYIHHGENR